MDDLYHVMNYIDDKERQYTSESDCLELLISKAMDNNFHYAFEIRTSTRSKNKENAVKRALFAVRKLGYTAEYINVVDYDMISIILETPIYNVFDIQAILWFTRERFKIPRETTEFADYVYSKALDGFYKNTLIYLYFRSKNYLFDDDINTFFGTVANGPVTLINYFMFEDLIPGWMLGEFHHRASLHSH